MVEEIEQLLAFNSKVELLTWTSNYSHKVIEN